MSENQLVVKFRQELLKRGPAGIKDIGLYFRQLDDDGSRSLSLEEFKKGISDHNINLSENEAMSLYRLFDQDASNSINYDEFLLSIRPPLNSARLSLIHKAFEKLDKTKDNKITIDDLKNVYNVKFHPKYISGEWSEEQVLRKFLDQFDANQHKDGIVTYDEFVLYYAGVSSSIDSDAYFDVMMRQCWKI